MNYLFSKRMKDIMDPSLPFVIYHKSDFDGIFSGAAARRALGDNAHYLGWDYGDPVPDVPKENLLFIVDLSIDGLMEHPKLIWIDHHISAIERYPSTIGGVRIDGVAASRLCYQWFVNNLDGATFPTKEDFVDRKVVEPLSFRLVGERDIWDKRDPAADLFEYGLRSKNNLDWDYLFDMGQEGFSYVSIILERGKVARAYNLKEYSQVLEAKGYPISFEGRRFLCCNNSRPGSDLFSSNKDDSFDGYLVFSWAGKDKKWKVSMYGTPFKPDVEFVEIAKKHGGGGHPRACGFAVDELPEEILYAVP